MFIRASPFFSLLTSVCGARSRRLDQAERLALIETIRSQDLILKHRMFGVQQQNSIQQIWELSTDSCRELPLARLDSTSESMHNVAH